jgi:multicomponent Na+:H+ antiporter subunit B
VLTLLIGLIFLALIIVSIAIVLQKDLATTVVLFMGFGLGSTLLYFLFSAPDVALTEAVISAGMSGVVLFIAVLKTRHTKGSV